MQIRQKSGTYTDLLFVTGGTIAAHPEQWRCAPFICRSQAEADLAAIYLGQRYWALLNHTENDSTADSMLGSTGGAIGMANKIKAMNGNYAHITFAEGDVDGAATTPALEWYTMLVGYNPTTGDGYTFNIMHTFTNAAGAGAQVTVSAANAAITTAPTNIGSFGNAMTGVRAANAAITFSDNGRLLVPVIVDFERCA